MINLIKYMIDADYRHLQRVYKIANAADKLQDEMRAKSDDELRALYMKIHRKLQKLNDKDIIQAVALIREVDFRVLNQFPYYVQLVGGIVLYFNDIAEMKTGEGKTLTSTIPIFLKSLEGSYIHVVTTNEYLSKRDYELLKPVYDFFGITCGLNRREYDRTSKQTVFKNQIVYTTNSELGFDYLRDSFVMSSYEKVVSRLDYALIDEIDSILIDEARTPLIISGAKNEDLQDYVRTQNFIKSLSNIDINVDIETRSVFLEESGVQKAHQFFNKDNLYKPENVGIVHRINQALKANYIFNRDIDYVVMNDEILIVDEYTGRILPGRQYSEGLHQALQAKEGVTIKAENITEATITYQNLFRLYNELAGMSGTSKSEEIELFTTYNLRTFEIPTNKAVIRIDDKDLYFETINEKKKAIIEDALKFKAEGHPVLIGTGSIEDSVILSNELTMRKVNHVVLNGTQDISEAEIVARAGESGRITIATNIAGRGTDIPLDQKAIECGGLCILGYQRYDSKRIDNQLKGRSGRQGDPGYTRMYVSLEDNLIVVNATDEQKEKLKKMLKTHKGIHKLVDLIQKQAESNHYNARKKLLAYDDELALHRKIIFNLRDDLLNIVNLRKEVSYAIHLYLDNKMKSINSKEEFLMWQSSVIGQYRINPAILEAENKVMYLEECEERIMMDIDANLHFSYEILQIIMLKYLNYIWKNHVEIMMSLKRGIELRAKGGVKPEDAYREEAYKLFRKMWNDYYDYIGTLLFCTKN